MYPLQGWFFFNHKDYKISKKMNTQRIRYDKSIQEQVVQAIFNGELLAEEAMLKYGIMSRKTIVRWLKKYKKALEK